MHLLCRNDECVGHALPAGTVEDEHCRFCGALLADENDYVLVQGAPPEMPDDFSAVMDALRDAGHEVQVIELAAVRVGDKLLVSAMTERGELASAEVCEGDRAREVEDVMGLLERDG
ncbi:MAG TPA: hypothetical protein VF192_01000 [Longimicrobiales bacterium]